MGVDVAAKLVEDWLGIDVKVKALGVDTFDMASVVVWNRLPEAALSQTMSNWRISWEAAPAVIRAIRMNEFFWIRKESGKIARFMHKDALLLHVKLLILCRSSVFVEKAEV